jgi:hypothetical protein
MRAIFWAGISAACASEPSACNWIWKNGCFEQLAKNELVSRRVTLFGKVHASDDLPIHTLDRDRVNDNDQADVAKQPAAYTRRSAASRPELRLPPAF